jgi:hypothetical protein
LEAEILQGGTERRLRWISIFLRKWTTKDPAFTGVASSDESHPSEEGPNSASLYHSPHVEQEERLSLRLRHLPTQQGRDCTRITIESLVATGLRSLGEGEEDHRVKLQDRDDTSQQPSPRSPLSQISRLESLRVMALDATGWPIFDFPRAPRRRWMSDDACPKIG